MLDDCLIASRGRARTKKPFTVLLSVMTHGVIFGALILIPLFQTPLLPQPPDVPLLHPPVAAPRAVELVPTPRLSGGPAQVQSPPSSDLILPDRIPDRIAFVIDEPMNDSLIGIQGIGTGSTIPGGVPFGTERLLPPAPQPPPPAPPPAPPPLPVAVPDVPAGPMRLPGGQVEKSNLIHQVNPVYPDLARRVRAEGLVLMEAIITREGTIDKLRVLSGHPLLRDAAVEAVRQWRYRPTLLNGKPVEVITTISVNFRMD